MTAANPPHSAAETWHPSDTPLSRLPVSRSSGINNARGPYVVERPMLMATRRIDVMIAGSRVSTSANNGSASRAIGRDCRNAAPVCGVRSDGGGEALRVAVVVAASAQHQQ